MQNFLFRPRILNFSALLLLAMLVTLTGCGSSATTTGASSTTVASLQLTTSATTVKSDNSTSTTITITAVDASNAAVPSATIAVSTNTGITSPGPFVTDTTGKTTLTFSSGTVSQANRAATITATAGTVTGQVVVQIVGSTVTVSSSTTSVPDDGSNPATLTIAALDAGGNAISGVAVTLTESGSGNVTITPSSLVTDSNGQITATVVGVSGGIGSVSVGIAAAGTTATTGLTVTPTAATFAIDQQKLNTVLITNNEVTAMQIGQSLEVRVNVPGTTPSVYFTTTTGVWNGATNVELVSVVAGKATATLTTTQAGTATITVLASDTLNTDNLTVAMTAAATSAYSITLQAAPSTVAKNLINASTLTATVNNINGYPVGGAPVVFNILNPTGGGETLSSVLAFTDASGVTSGLSLGQAQTKFNSGSLSSGQTGVQVRAQVVGTSVATEAAGVNMTPSGNDAAITIGGTAGSVVISYAVQLAENTTKTNYIWEMSVTVADSNGNPVVGAAVNLSAWPIAWSTGSGCMFDADVVSGVTATGTFDNEDSDENLILGGTEDGVREFYYSAASAVGGTVDTKITPPNSAAGTLPSTVTTDASGVATFQLTYPKSSAIWVVDRIRAKTVVQGSEAVGELVIRLAALINDAAPPDTCFLPPSPYSF